MATRLSAAVRGLAPVLCRTGDGRTELLALIWGARFDRAHALQLAAGAPPAVAALLAAADRYDALPRRQQERLRRLAARALRDNGPCPASC